MLEVLLMQTARWWMEVVQHCFWGCWRFTRVHTIVCSIRISFQGVGYGNMWYASDSDIIVYHFHLSQL